MKSICQVLIFISLVIGGSSQPPCSEKNITISQTKNGALVKNKPEWKVTISNQCFCTQLDLKLECNGYQTVEKVDPSILTVSASGQCLVNNGQPIHPHENITFTYAWDTSYPFSPLSAQVACS